MNLFVIGNPIKHSKSPQIHNFWLKSYNLNYKYKKKIIEEHKFESLISKIRNGNILGVNITLPFKTQLIKYVDSVDNNAKKIGAINTIYKSNNKVIGTNTDGIGFVNSLKKDAKRNLREQKVLILGSGGAARGIIFELLKQKVALITIKNRNYEKAENLRKDILKSTKFSNINTVIWKMELLTEKYDIVINTTSFGMKKNEHLDFNFMNLNSNALVCDIIYNPLETYFLSQAKARNIQTLNGIGMLIRQAEVSFYKWFKIKVSEKKILEIKHFLEQSIK